MSKQLLLVLALISAGCASSRGFNRGELREQLNGKTEVSDADIAKVLATKAQLPKPFRLGIYFKDPVAKHQYDHPKWKWTDEDKNKILKLAEKMKTIGEISDVFPISDATVTSSDLKSLRLAAARHGADALLIVTGINDVDSYTNNWGWTYIALVPALFVPASVNDSLFMAKAAMWDVRNEFLYMTAESESLKSETKPAAFTDERKITFDAKTDAMDKLSGEISKLIEGLASAKARPNSSHQ